MQERYTNRLINETSPYLLQHAHNPVDWHAWGDEALEMARKEDKLMLISIGYSACHWCHVMERETFEDVSVAEVMNQHFVCIKVDREEHPDIDHIYMDAVQLISGRGGWPLNCFALPDGRPVYGGTYYPKENWIQVLEGLHQLYVNEKEKLLQQAEAVTQGVRDISPLLATNSSAGFGASHLDEYYKNLSATFDSQWGGRKGEPKFPMPDVQRFLLYYYYQTQHESALHHVLLTLNKMSLGGIYDHLGGGFARYSTDGYWKVPHFEKMLYDNAQLVSLYSEAFSLTKDENYRRIIEETLKFVREELTSLEGRFYAALDADSEGDEGKYYVWERDTVEKLLGENAEGFCNLYNIQKQGNWEEGKNVLFLNSFPEKTKALREAKQQLLDFRKTRIKPSLDSKIICSWNALMIIAYVDAYQSIGNREYLDTALQAANSLRQHHIKAEGLLFRISNDSTQIAGFLDDCSYTTLAFIRLYEVSGDEEWIKTALQLAQYALENFYDHETGLFFYSGSQGTFARKQEIHDNVTPSSNAVMAEVLLRLGLFFDRISFRETAQKMVNVVLDSVKKYAEYHSYWAKVLGMIVYHYYEIVIAGANAARLAMEFQARYTPDAMLCFTNQASDLPLFKNRFVPGRTYIYVCKEGSCHLPVETVKEAIELIESSNKL